MCVRVCARVCPIFNVSSPDNSQTVWDSDMKFSTPVKQLQPSNSDYFHDHWCSICNFIGFWIFWKKNYQAEILCVNALIVNDVWYEILWDL